MLFARFFVTSVSALVIALAFGSTGRLDPRAALVDQGNAELVQAALIEADLASQYGLVLENTSSQKFNWMHFSVAERQSIKGKLSAYLSHTMKVMALDSEKGIYIQDKEKLTAKIEFAFAIQKSVDIFEARQ